MLKAGLLLPVLFSSAGSIIYSIALFGMDILIAYKYGTSSQAAILQSAIIISTLLIGMWSGGAVIGAFVPIFVRLGGDQKKAAAIAFLQSSLSIILMIMPPLLIVVALAMPLIIVYLASGFTLQERMGVSNTLLITSSHGSNALHSLCVL